jgi:hypothetical protein
LQKMSTVKLFRKSNKITKNLSPKSWGWALELKYDSLPRLDFKEVFCIGITDPPVAKVAYKIELKTRIKISSEPLIGVKKG